MEYKIPDHLKGDTFDGVVFTVSVNSTPLDLTGASLKMTLVKQAPQKDIKVKTPVLTLTSPLGGLSLVNGPAGRFQIDKQIINVPPDVYAYDIQITLSDGTVKTYISGTWKILPDITT